MDPETSAPAAPAASGRQAGLFLLAVLVVAAPGLVSGVLSAGVWLLTQGWLIVPAAAVYAVVRWQPRRARIAVALLRQAAARTRQPKAA